jgi:hypothetical protein
MADGDRGGGIRVYGCSPGCLLVSLLVSVALTILINALIRLERYLTEGSASLQHFAEVTGDPHSA